MFREVGQIRLANGLENDLLLLRSLEYNRFFEWLPYEICFLVVIQQRRYRTVFKCYVI